MADKGFDIKVLIPTEDGITVSSNKLINVPYYLMYNISNRSYQLAGKIKTIEYFTDEDYKSKLDKLILEENIDFVIAYSPQFNLKVIKPGSDDVSEVLNTLIDKIDQKKELL